MSEKEDKMSVNTENSSELSEDALNSVSGGLFGITIIDTCPQKYEYHHCCKNFGKCPQLIVICENIEVVDANRVHNITCSCNKGFFNCVTDTHKI